jgi:hypothetical protein
MKEMTPRKALIEHLKTYHGKQRTSWGTISDLSIQHRRLHVYASAKPGEKIVGHSHIRDTGIDTKILPPMREE